MTSDEGLMLQFQRGSHEAFAVLFARYRGPLYDLFRRRGLREERAEDLVQETFLTMIQGAPRYKPHSLVRTYLYGIALDRLHAELRHLAKAA